MLETLEQQKVMKLNPRDSVVVALAPIAKGETLSFESEEIQVTENIPQGHKIALVPLKKTMMSSNTVIRSVT